MSEENSGMSIGYAAFVLGMMLLIAVVNLYIQQGQLEDQLDVGIDETLQNRQETLENRDINNEILERLKNLEERIDKK